ncbi:DUF6452 family protein [Polaribacter sp. WD7]|uniref:DUF6452 family protein n=1 Tax=Polaribacter sp. WD7 TaxID=2269061 RepID=UPI0021623A58|nr:DUF6452 family protein [Polaribacter sp. WD7]
MKINFKKISVLLGLLLLINTACEKDDFCLQNPVTPNLVLRFYDNVNRETVKNVERLSIIAASKTDSLFTNFTSDSIAIPLNSLSNSTVYTLKMNNQNGNIATNQIATFTVSYTTEEIHVSRSCGFKINFNDVNFSPENDGWILDFTQNTFTIDNQNAAHVQIFH